jgi:DNA end-binding protein Ku
MARKNRKSGGERERTRRVPVRPFWSGTISFGLINVPVQLFPAVRRTSAPLRMLDEDGTPLRRRYYCPAHDRLVESDEIVRGYELDDEAHVVVSDEELEAIEPKKSREIDLQRFVDLGSVPPLHFNRSYFLTPTGDSNKAYRLLAEVMERTGRAGIATFVMRGREYLVAILSERGILRADTLRFSDEVRTAEEVGLDEIREPDPELVSRFEEAIEAGEADSLDPDELTDGSAGRLLALAKAKRAKGRDVFEPRGGDEDEDAEEDEGFEGIDLLQTIRISLHGGNGSGSNGGDREGEEALEELPKTRLYELAQELDIEGRSKMDREALIEALRRRG